MEMRGYRLSPAAIVPAFLEYGVSGPQLVRVPRPSETKNRFPSSPARSLVTILTELRM